MAANRQEIETEGARLVGFEIDRRFVRAVVLSPDGASILAYADSSVIEPGTEDDVFPNPGPAIASIWDKLQLGQNQNQKLKVAASFGFRNAGIGSGESIKAWIDAMSEQSDEQVAVVSTTGSSVAYAPQAHVDVVRNSFRTVGCEPDAIELSPVSVGRTLSTDASCVLTIGSGIAWRVRVFNGAILEALPYTNGVTRQGVHIEYFGQAEHPLLSIDRVAVPAQLLASQQLSVGVLAIAVGASLGLIDVCSIGNFCPTIDEPTDAGAGADNVLEASPVVPGFESELRTSTLHPSPIITAHTRSEPESVVSILVGNESTESLDKANDHDVLSDSNDSGESSIVRDGDDADLNADDAPGDLEVDEDAEVLADVEAPLDSGTNGQQNDGDRDESTKSEVQVRSTPPMPAEHLALKNSVEDAPGSDPSTTTTMPARPPLAPISTPLESLAESESESEYGPASSTDSNGDVSIFSYDGRKQQPPKREAVVEQEQAPEQVVPVPLVDASTTDERSGGNEVQNNRTMKVAGWSDSEFNNKVETVGPASTESIAPLDPIETQPVPPLGLIGSANASIDRLGGIESSSSQWQPFISPASPDSEPVLNDSFPGPVQPRYPKVGIDRGFDAVVERNTDEGFPVIDAPVSSELTQSESDSALSSGLSNEVSFGDAKGNDSLSLPATNLSVEVNQLSDSSNLAEFATVAQTDLVVKPTYPPDVSELTVAGKVPVENAAAHLEAQLDAEEALSSELVTPEVRSIQQPGPRRAVERSTKLWPYVLVGVVFFFVVAVAAYIWQIGL